jgi:molybdopterin/thiamine biosynthesis adenylyltransferase
MLAPLPRSVADNEAAAIRSRASFVVIGAGGLGCPALLGLQAGGAQRITIIDDDRVDLSNLARQVLFATADVGLDKVEAARQSLLGRSRAGSPTPTVTPLRRRLDAEQLPAILAELELGADDVVLECSDSPAMKFAVHDACVRAGVCVVIGGVVGWHGQAMAVDPRRPEAACYRCLFEAPPPPELAPACATAGVFGPVAGALGHAMATLAIGLATDLDHRARSPAGICLHFDLLRGQVRRLAPKPRPDCPTRSHCNSASGPA